MLTLVIPVYNEDATVKLFYEEVRKIENDIDEEIEFLFVNDGSTDNTMMEILRLKNADSRIHYIELSRNFGKEAALLAGLDYANGDWVATMDVDMQDPPSLIPRMMSKAKECPELDCIAARRMTRKGESIVKSGLAKLFYKIINRVSSIEILDGTRDFRLMSRRMVNAVIQDREYNRFTKGLYAWVGFNTYWVEYDNVERISGETKWSLHKLFMYAIEGILAYTVTPLYISSLLGVLLCIVSFAALFLIVARAFIYGDPVAGWPSMVSIIIFLGGLILFNLGIIGLYLSKTYMETKHRQIYIIRSKG